jgi:hypothetical protein
MKKISWKSPPFMLATILLLLAILFSVWAWCLSDAGLPIVQKHFMRNYGKLAWSPLYLTYSDKWIVESVTRPEDGAVLVYGFWASGKTVSAKTASLGLKRRDTGDQISVVVAPINSDRAGPDNYAECLQTKRCRGGLRGFSPYSQSTACGFKRHSATECEFFVQMTSHTLGRFSEVSVIPKG